MKRTALLIIDVQVGLIREGVHNGEGILRRIAELADRARAAGAPVIYVQDLDVGGAGTPDFQVHPVVAPRAGEVAISKTVCDSFYETPLHDELTTSGVGHLVIAGLKSQFCIDTSVRRATSLGYDVTLVGDAHSTNDSSALRAPQIIAHTNATLNDFSAAGSCRVLPSSEIKF